MPRPGLHAAVSRGPQAAVLSAAKNAARSATRFLLARRRTAASCGSGIHAGRLPDFFAAASMPPQCTRSKDQWSGYRSSPRETFLSAGLVGLGRNCRIHAAISAAPSAAAREVEDPRKKPPLGGVFFSVRKKVRQKNTVEKSKPKQLYTNARKIKEIIDERKRVDKRPVKRI